MCLLQKLPIPRPFMRVALSMMRRSVRKRAHFSIDDVAPLDYVGETFVPVLFGEQPFSCTLLMGCGGSCPACCIAAISCRLMGECTMHLFGPSATSWSTWTVQGMLRRTRLLGNTTVSVWWRHTPATRTLSRFVVITTVSGDRSSGVRTSERSTSRMHAVDGWLLSNLT
jgi:hypothetical protein